jgi:hypothetical protein
MESILYIYGVSSSNRSAKLSIYFGITKLSSKMALNQHFYKMETTLPNTPSGNLNPEVEGKKSSPI